MATLALGLSLAGAVQADEALAPSMALESSAPLNLAPTFGPHSKLYTLALADSQPAASALAATAPAPYTPPLFTLGKAHKYLGLGTLALVALTAVTAPDDGCEHGCPAGASPRKTSGTTHTRLARAAAFAAAATVGTGVLAHWGDLYLADGLGDPDNQHALLGLAGSVLMMIAVNKSIHSSVPTSHAATAEVGGLAMAVAIKLTW